MNMLLVDSRQDDSWLDELARHLPDFDVRSSVDDVDLAAVTHVAMWRLPVEQLAAMANLEAICMMGAGFDHLELDALPDVPIVRLVDPAMANDIALYVLSWAVHFQREFDRFSAHQTAATWRDNVAPVFQRDYTVGVFGSGAIGQVVLDTCAHHGFATLGWSRSNHDRPLDQFFTDCDLVVDLVPLSAATRGVIGAAELRALGDGVLINVGRGATIDTDALLEALDGQLRAAVLDVFEIEPLPADSPLWSHDKVTVTPHIAGRSDPVTAAPIIAASIAELRSGALPATTVSR
ncbi:NAD(P)-dependent oxidoreductase [uncultured Ilumatobacter sp.]|jgi:glyoxylate/hydroxypyruvate reductase|uniref:NAD(P)-dependent oxidoreductase n=1 Tax=uncultured Ilumatobacter sp. TaxID=879968 RepID=UPI00374E6D73